MKALISKLALTFAFVPSIAAYSVGKNRRVFVGTPIHQNRRLVQDCMTPLSRLCTLTETATVDEAVYLLLKLDVSGAPVINELTGELLGIVSTFDFLQQEAGDGALLPIEGTMENVKDYLNRAKKICATRVGDLMSPNPVTMSPEESMRNAAILMSQKNLHRLPIVENGRLVGMLTSSDVMIDMVRVVKSLPPAASKDDLISP
mmetsp:Transcript_6273/g.11859  ORF Transcript_6273/g.11859 Transcript_6273/m.11859 type:complete len:203 (-) Transcript_6273:218-826(-)